MDTAIITLSPELLAALRGIAPKPRHPKVPYVFALALITVVAAIGRNKPMRDFLATEWHAHASRTLASTLGSSGAAVALAAVAPASPSPAVVAPAVVAAPPREDTVAPQATDLAAASATAAPQLAAPGNHAPHRPAPRRAARAHR